MRFVDLIDIALITVLVYAAGSWLRQARARYIVSGLAVLIGLYLLARALELYLSQALFDVGLPALFISLLIIFQEDLRRGVERIARLGPRAGRRASRVSLDVLVESVAQLARDRVGALLVLPGSDPLERHINGGVTLHGRLSAPLLFSLFDPHSAGHDGAVIVEGEQVRTFAVHLPLSAQAPELIGAERGTRHAAALGLSERCDALVIVVSEEHGCISVAYRGILHSISDAAQLTHEIRAFQGVPLPKGSATPQRLCGRRSGALAWKCLAPAIAAGAWCIMAVQRQDIVVHTLDLPVTYHDAPADWLVEQPEPSRASVTISAPAPILQRIESDGPSLEVDLADVRDGEGIIKLGAYNLQLPPEAAVQRIEPPQVRVVTHKTRQRELTVNPTFRGALPSGVTLASVEVEPRDIPVLVAEEAAPNITHLATEPIDLAAVRDDHEREVGVELPEDTRLAHGTQGKVAVKIHLQHDGSTLEP